MEETEVPCDSPADDEPVGGSIFPEAWREGVYQAIYRRRDVRRFRPDPIPSETLARLLKAAHHAPSVGFMQPWNFIVIANRETRMKVKDLTAGWRRRQPLESVIFWGTSWGTYSGDKISGIDLWYQGFGNSYCAMTSDEYTGSNGQVTPSVSYIGHVIDTSPAAGGGSTSTILAEVCRVVTNPQPSGYYAVYTDVPRGSAGYCAWHSYGSCNGTNVQFAFFFDLDGDPGCDPQDTSGLHSQGLAAIANVSGHELSEARTDPRNGGWYDSRGYENGDKCAWTFGAPLVTFSNGQAWKIQGEWSNNAYNTGTGYPNSSGQNGCLSGL